MTEFITALNALLWGAPALVLILGVGLYLSILLRFPQLRLFPKALGTFFGKLRGGTSSFRALCTALAATVGTGNLVGVAGAICLGGPGAIFWMWICGFVGMATKYAEATLAVRYRVRTKDGCGAGPMYVITGGMGKNWTWLARVYSLLCVAASFGVGNTVQINAVVTGVNDVLCRFGGTPSRYGELFLGLVLAAVVGSLLFGGAGRIGAAAERLVPLVSGFYMLMCAGVLILRIRAVPGAFLAILEGAVSPRAVTGGVLGSAFTALRVGCSRGVFTNEAGMGTASIAHGAAQVSHPVEQGLMGIVEVFLDTVVICTLTALVILVSGVPIPYGHDAGGELTSAAFAALYGDGAAVVLTLALCCFAIATVLGWGFYGGRCAQYLMGSRGWRVFALAQTAAVLLGAVLDTADLWQISGVLNGMMVIPNLFALAVLAPEAARLTIDYTENGSPAAGGGNYADFHQRKPL